MDKRYTYQIGFMGLYKHLQPVVDSLHDGSFPMGDGIGIGRGRRISYNWFDVDYTNKHPSVLDVMLETKTSPQHAREVMTEGIDREVHFNMWVSVDSITEQPAD